MSDDKKTLLIVEDDPGLQKQLKWSFDNYNVIIAGDRNEAITALRRYNPSVVTLDLGLPPDPANASEGLATLKEILELAPCTKVIVVTGNDDRDVAVQAVAMGAYDFYQKPVELDTLNLIIDRAFHLDDLEKENLRLSHKTDEPLDGMIAVSKPMLDLARMVEKIAPSDVTTLLLGDSGTGKELLAKALHNLSSRKNKPFVAVNSAAIPENLLESELFGYEKGAFTGAVKQTKGKIEYADKGTFFLDEIGDLPMALQAKLLRFLQERTIERIGGRSEIPVDIRIVCATHQNLRDLIKEGKFREDLYYRLAEMTINIPPLREREGDAIVIATALAKRFSEQQHKKVKGFTKEAAQMIENYQWPGNIRELENKVKRAVIMADGMHITAEDLELNRTTEDSSLPLNLKEVREMAETSAIKRALSYADNNVSKTAKLLGVTRPTLYTLFNKYGIQSNHIEN
ncbi:MAG: PEP-CTERM-box response regulator transcription factor [Gammaproteobacteria bacterium]|nr:PEP-CTERM-box response regulator transcription factor [Gammaproteobacteria bacterium]